MSLLSWPLNIEGEAGAWLQSGERWAHAAGCTLSHILPWRSHGGRSRGPPAPWSSSRPPKVDVSVEQLACIDARSNQLASRKRRSPAGEAQDGLAVRVFHARLGVGLVTAHGVMQNGRREREVNADAVADLEEELLPFPSFQTYLSSGV